MKATAKDLRFQSRELLNTVKRGEEVVITYRGKPCAKLVPYHKERKTNKEDEVFAMSENNGWDLRNLCYSSA